MHAKLRADVGTLPLDLSGGWTFVGVKSDVFVPISSAMRGSRFAPFCAVLVTLAATAVAALTSRAEDWDRPLVIVLIGALALIADRHAIRSATGTKVIATHPVFVLGMVTLGPLPMLIIGELVIFTNRPSTKGRLAGNACYYATFLVVGALLARLAHDNLGVTQESAWFSLAVVALYIVTLAINIALVAAYLWWLEGARIDRELSATAWPLISTNLTLACATAVLVYLVSVVGAAAIILCGIILVAHSRLQRDLMQAERHAETARKLAAEAQAQRDGLVRIILDFVDARDQMTARHSAAVARYARRIAEAAGCPESEQQLVHTAALYHDVGKVMFADRMFKAAKLTDEEWEIVKRHPERGAELVGHLPNHAEVAEIILSHHERIDGRGYPRGLSGEDIPRLSRMISIADTYDVMTGRDSYRAPVSPAEAIEELRRVSGSQLDAELVELFVERVLAVEDVAFRHGDDADFEAELEAERKARDSVHPDLEPAELAPPALEAA
jgi:putative nucleotidyltransferase with HDIG domain